MTKVVNTRFAQGRGEYERVISTIDHIGKCPFCPTNFIYHKKPILKKYKGWIITKNSWPYKNSQKHLVIMPLNHKEQFAELTIDDFKTLKYLVNWANKNLNIKGGGLALRFGDTNYTGATVYHLHFHLIVPKLDRKKLSKPVYFPIG